MNSKQVNLARKHRKNQERLRKLKALERNTPKKRKNARSSA